MNRSDGSVVALDLHLLGSHETGNETYARELASSLCARRAFEYKLLVSERQSLPPPLRDHAGVVEIGQWPSVVRVGFQYPRLFGSLGIGLAHMPTYVVPPRITCASVVTVLDVSFMVHPELVQPRVRWMLRALVGPSMAAATKVITISESSKRDIVRLYSIAPEKVSVTPLAAGPEFTRRPDSEISQVRQKYGLPQSYVLAVGNILPRKNIARLVEAFSIVASEVPDVHLVLVGRSAWKGSEVERRVSALGLARRVHFVGYVPDADLPAIYSGASVFCFPSIYEGFGLPVLEAMACGTPTIASDASSLPEVVGDAGLTFPSESVPEMARVLRRVLLERGLRARLAADGLQRASMFTWERTAALTEEVFQGALNHRDGPPE